MRKSAFNLDPEIKREALWAGPFLRPATLLVERGGGGVRIRDADGRWHAGGHVLQPFDSMLSEFADPERAPELLTLRERIRSWRFYDHLRTDTDAPARQVQIGTRTTILGPEGADVAAALQTIREIGPNGALDEAIEQAFPGSRVEPIRACTMATISGDVARLSITPLPNRRECAAADAIHRWDRRAIRGRKVRPQRAL